MGAEADPRKLRAEFNKGVEGKWVKYNGRWHTPLEWLSFTRSTFNHIPAESLQYKFATELLHEGRECQKPCWLRRSADYLRLIKRQEMGSAYLLTSKNISKWKRM